jgi:phosphatidylglycerophosphate synthase
MHASDPVRNRRPIAARELKLSRLAATWLARHGASANAISSAGMIAGILAGLALAFTHGPAAPILWFVAALMIQLRLVANMLDGMVALESGKASLRGEIVNELPDRVSDIVIFVGVAHGGLASPFPAYWAAIMAVMTAYVGVLGQAVGARREYGGLMSKLWRMVVLHAGAWITLACVEWRDGDIRLGGLTVLDWTCLAIVAGCVQTLASRLRRTLAALREKAAR